MYNSYNESVVIAKNEAKLKVIEKILTEYVNDRFKEYSVIKRKHSANMELAIEKEYEAMVACGKNDNSSVINLYYIKRLLKAVHLLQTCKDILNKLAIDEKYRTHDFNDDFYGFFVSNQDYHDIMEEFAFNRYFKKNYRNLSDEKRHILNEYLKSDVKVKKMSNGVSTH